MRGQLEQTLLFIHKEMDSVSKRDIIKAIEDRLDTNSFGARTNVGKVAILKKLRDTFNNFGNLYNEAILDLTKELSKSKDIENQRKYRSYELATIFNVTPAAVSTWIKKGEFKNVIQEGRKVILIESDIDFFVESHPKLKKLWETRI